MIRKKNYKHAIFSSIHFQRLFGKNYFTMDFQNSKILKAK